MTEEEYRQEVANELARRQHREYLGKYSYLQELREQYPEQYFRKFEEPPGVYGYTRGTRYSGAKNVPYLIKLLENMPPEEFDDSLKHELRHLGIDKSSNWSYIMGLQEPTDRLKEILSNTSIRYPEAAMPEEGMIRHLGDPRLPTNYDITKDRWSLTPTQRELLPYLESYSTYGPQWGSMWGPEYDEDELRQGKGSNIDRKYNFHLTNRGRTMAINKADLPMSSPDYDKILVDLLSKYPRLRQEKWKVMDYTDPNHPYHDPRYFSSFYGPEETGNEREGGNPFPGNSTILVYKNTVNPEDAIKGEMLHRLSQSDAGFRSLRDKVITARSPRYKDIDQKVYQESRDTRPYENFLNFSRHDAYLRALMSPKDNPEWPTKEIWGDQEQALREEIENYLMTEPKEEKETTIRDVYSPRWRDLVR